MAGQVAEIEDEVATTLERMAGIGPADRTERLLAKAEHARPLPSMSEWSKFGGSASTTADRPRNRRESAALIP
ncbi:MAG: hypothetical protein ACR2JK_02880 [Geodermatophilaceae bacterium]